jgi:predicted PurR-regulated permease PerM
VTIDPAPPEPGGSRFRTDRSRVQILAFYGALLLLGYLLYRVFEPFLVPLGWAGVLVIVCSRWNAALAHRYGPTRAAILSTLFVAVAIIGPGMLIMTAFVRETAEAVGNAQRALEGGGLARLQGAADWIQQRLFGREPVSIGVLIQQLGTRFGGQALQQAGTLVRNVAVFAFDLIVTLFAVFFLFRDGRGIMRVLRRALPFEAATRERLIAESSELIAASVTSGLIVAAVQGGLGGAAFALLGLGSAVFWGVVMGFFALLPFGGAWVVWLPAGIWLLATGHPGRGIALLAIGAAVVSGVDNLLRPALLSERARLNGLLIFIGLLGGVSAFGLLGLILGPVVIAVAVALLEAYTDPGLTVEREA